MGDATEEQLRELNERVQELVRITRENAGENPFDDEVSRTGEIAVGRNVTVKSQGGDSPVDIVYATYRRPKSCAYKLQCTSSTGGVGVLITILEATYGAQFTRQFLLHQGAPARTVMLYGRTINVRAQTPKTSETAAYQAVVNALITSENLDVLGALYPLFVPWVQTVASTQTIVNGAGTGILPPGATTFGFLLGGEGYVNALGTGDAAGTTYFVQYYDVPSTATSLVGLTPIYEIGPLPVGVEFSFSHDVRPDIEFTTGLVVAFSKTPQTYTAVGANAVVRADTTVGF